MVASMKLFHGALLAVVSLPLCSQSRAQGGEVFSLSLADLSTVRVGVPAAFTRLAEAEIPASITTISADDIARTPARNIYDLIETYVPGAIWMTHEEGPVFGIRGIIDNRNLKYLLLVNGRSLNNKQFF